MVFVLSAFTHSPTALNPATFLPNALLPLHGGALIFSIGTTDASGELQLNLLAPPPVPGGLSTTLFTQAFFVNAGLTLPIVLGAPQALTLLDATL